MTDRGQRGSTTAQMDEQAARIAEYEAMMDEAIGLLGSGQMSAKLCGLIDALGAYYQSPQWMRDFADDEAGRLPEGLRRGVLSEDGIYDLLEAFDELKSEIGENELF